MSKDEHPKGKPVAIDHNAISASSTEPAFVARPKGAPVYHGFVVLEDVSVEGFTFGAITDFEAEPCDTGDAFVVAPDGSRAGLVWEVSPTKYFEEVRPFERHVPCFVRAWRMRADTCLGLRPRAEPAPC